jgi:hypothetical protein
MKQIVKLELLFLVTIQIACQREKKDDILFTDIVPDKFVTTFVKNIDEELINNVVAAALNLRLFENDTIYTAALSITSLDLNKDDIEDYQIVLEHELIDSTNGHDFNEFIIQINSYSNNLISLSNKATGYIKNYKQNDVMVDSSFGTNMRFSLNTPGGYLLNINKQEDFRLSDDVYCGIKVQKNNLFYFGWIHLKIDFFSVTLCEYAISTIPEFKLKIGQK